ncbi:hypothetical protein DHW03_11300 [Pedobacter yonginense]|uniref:Peptidase S54 rhomboid domain-containing protein n=1 Tax=Pedobacter yonginense TaxID=651869 RepID=A0A317EMT9_9SPHI|nr:rhomboid family intramembrane serine protease [Pedobacter yonginense]PWS28131.1 hypothetical protein DHW03_11300 [Pedobacter yonginense]
MSISWGYSPKIEKYIPLADFPADKYLIIAQQAIENLGWNLSHISETGIIAYTSVSFQSYSEEISIRIHGNFAVFKSECVGIQMFFNDYGKNDVNLDLFFHEFEYIQYHLKDIWDEKLLHFHQLIANQDDTYFEKAPLTAKNRIKNFLYLFLPQKGYLVTPILIWLNAFYFIFSILFIAIVFENRSDQSLISEVITNAYLNLGSNSRELVLEGQYWRLITHQFIHLSISHVFFNMYALVYIGLMVEHKLGSKNFILLYILSGVCGGLLSLMFHPIGIMAGASGAIMGLFGAFLAMVLSNAFERSANKALLLSTILVTAIMLLNGFVGERVDNSAHLGGLISGFTLGYLLFNETILNKHWTLKLRYTSVAVITLMVAGLILWFTPNYQIRRFNELQFAFEQNSFDFNKVYNIPYDLSKEEKVLYIKKYGIKIWQKNKVIVNEMRKLNLPAKENYRRDFDDKIANRASKIALLLYKEYVEDTTRYRNEMEQLTDEINTIRLEAGSSEYKW